MAKMAIMAMANGSTNMAIIYIQRQGIEKLTQKCNFHLKKFMTVWIFWVKIYIVKMALFTLNLPAWYLMLIT